MSSKVLAGEVVAMSVDWEHIPAKHRQLIKAFLDEEMCIRDSDGGSFVDETKRTRGRCQKTLL